jgi:competence protein ComEC
MISWAPYTFLRITFFFILGILTYIHGLNNVDSSTLQFVFGLAIPLYLILYVFQRKLKKQALSVLLGIAGFTIIFCFGFLLTKQHTYINDPSHIAHHQEGLKNYTAVVSGWVQEKGQYYRTEVDVTAIRNEKGWVNATGRVQVYIDKNALNRIPAYGDLLLIKGAPLASKGPANPGEFDYRRYLSFQQVYQQHFVKENQVILYGHEPPALLMATAYSLRNWCNNALKANLGSSREYAIAAALILGVKDSLDNELQKAYSAAGAMHVLAVSGLHVGIIYMLLGFSLGWVKKQKGGKYLFALVVLTALWMYAFVTGLSASVLRAVTMFSVVTLAQTWQRSSSTYNTLSVSAFALLCFDPYLIMSVGFQLSYAAVIGIVYLYKPINSWINFNYWLPRYLWQITAVSIAAQVATVPVSMYYFHKLPVFFWLANIFVIPAAAIILVGGLVVMAIAWLTPVATLLGTSLAYFIGWINWIIFKVESLPHAQVTGIMPYAVEVWIIYLLIVLILMFFHFRKYLYLQLAAVVCLLLSAVNIFKLYGQQQQVSLVVYKVDRHSATAFHQGRQLYFFSDAALQQDKPKLEFHVQNDWWQKGVVQARFLNLGQEVGHGITVPVNIRKLPYFTAAVWHKSTVIFIDKAINDLPKDFKAYADYIIIQHNIIKPEAVFEHFSCSQLVIDSSVKPYVTEKFSAEAYKRHIPCHVVQTQGAFVAKLLK